MKSEGIVRELIQIKIRIAALIETKKKGQVIHMYVYTVKFANINWRKKLFLLNKRT